MNLRTALPIPALLTLLARILVLTYGGVALLQWVHYAILDGGEAAPLAGYAHLAQDGTLALPLVAGAVLLVAARARRLGPARAQGALVTLYAVVMGAGSLLH